MSSRLFDRGESKPGLWQKKFVGAAIIFVASLCFAPDAHACSCLLSYGQMQPCGAYWGADVVFTGVASEIGPMTPVEGGDGKLFTMNGPRHALYGRRGISRHIRRYSRNR